ncbi:MAG: ROK family protein [Acidobacteriota bacterium]|jgi:glucokinase|nr:ROK family protein [Acidobacteriota bacterium]
MKSGVRKSEESRRVVLGVDIGGTNTKFGYVDRQGECLASASMPTHAHQPAARFFSRLRQESRRLFRDLPKCCELAGIGMGAPNANFYKCTIEHPPNLSWNYVDVRAELEKHYSVPLAVTNDANAAALGEMLFGAARGMKNFIQITLGTGLGSGIVANGELIYGADGFAGEIGHTTVDPDGRMCGCGRRGCLETYCSATGLCRTIQELICNTAEPSPLRKVSYADLTAQMVSEAALQGDRLAKQAFEMCGRTLGMKLADSVAHLSPEAIILSGGMAAAGELIFEPTKRSLEDHVFPIFRNKVKVLPSRLAEGSAAILGAGALIWKVLGE